MQKTLLKTFLIWLPFAALITFACGLSYLLVQQDVRMSANDPQIQIAEDFAQYLENDATPGSLISPMDQPVEISTGLDPYVMIFDASGTVLASAATLHGATPAIPSGVFSHVQQYGEARFTWQPEPGVRSAVVVTPVTGSKPGFVLAGRSLREVEIREENLSHITALAWAAGIILMFMIIWVVVLAYRKKTVISA